MVSSIYEVVAFIMIPVVALAVFWVIGIILDDYLMRKDK